MSRTALATVLFALVASGCIRGPEPTTEVSPSGEFAYRWVETSPVLTLEIFRPSDSAVIFTEDMTFWKEYTTFAVWTGPQELQVFNADLGVRTITLEDDEWTFLAPTSPEWCPRGEMVSALIRRKIRSGYTADCDAG